MSSRTTTGLSTIFTYFTSLSEEQQEQMQLLAGLYQEWNSKINVISRKDIDSLYIKHVLHSLAIGKFIKFKAGSEILDLGCGGGFPGIPLAILFPEVDFHLVDGTGKKITVVHAVAEALGLTNVKAQHVRAEEIKDRKYDFVVTRAVATADKLLMWSRRLIKKKHNNPLPNGLIALKGGNPKDELGLLSKGEYADITPLKTWFDEPQFEDKYILYIQG